MVYFVGVILIVIVLGAWWYIQDKRRYSKYPPGPFRVPLLGCIPFFPVAPTPGAVFDKLAAKYGDVFHLKIGLVDVGQSLAETFLLIYFTSLLRTFKLEKVDGAVPSTVPKLGMTHTPYPFKVRFVPRK